MGEDYLDILLTIDQCGVTVSDWEADFISDMIERLQDGGGISPKQAEIIDRLYDTYVVNRGVRK